MINELEIISHTNATYHIFLNEILYRTPHLHKDFEICFLLEGSLKITTSEATLTVEKNDLWIINPFLQHEYQAVGNLPLLLIIQINPAFFSSYFNLIHNISFSLTAIHTESPEYSYLRELMVTTARCSFYRKERYELKCAELLIHIFDRLMDTVPFHTISDDEKNATKSRAKLLRKITSYIDDNYYHKLLLSDIAKEMNLTANYLSHFFKSASGISFQKYLAKIRCTQASILLRTTDLSLFDISISCGFSDTKYFTKNFQEFFGVHPNEFRKTALTITMEDPVGFSKQSGDLATSERKLSNLISKKIIDYYVEKQADS